MGVVALGVGSLGVGCAGRRHHDDGYYSSKCALAAHGSSQVELALRGVQHVTGGDSARMSLDQPMYSGDETALVLWTSEPVFVYVVNFAPDGAKNVVWPSGSAERVEGLKRIPEGGGYFRLTGQTGQELVAVVATRDEYGLDGDGKARVIGLVESTLARRDLRQLQSALPPGLAEGHATMGIRAVGLEVQGSSVHAHGSDPVVMLIDLDHRATEQR
jgi:hypothetical protein